MNLRHRLVRETYLVSFVVLIHSISKPFRQEWNAKTVACFRQEWNAKTVAWKGRQDLRWPSVYHSSAKSINSVVRSPFKSFLLSSISTNLYERVS